MMMKKYICENCGRSYTLKGSLHNHIRFECGKEPRCFCPFYGCGYKCKVKGNIKNHLRQKHKLNAMQINELILKSDHLTM